MYIHIGDIDIGTYILKYYLNIYNNMQLLTTHSFLFFKRQVALLANLRHFSCNHRPAAQTCRVVLASANELGTLALFLVVYIACIVSHNICGIFSPDKNNHKYCGIQLSCHCRHQTNNKITNAHFFRRTITDVVYQF